MIIDWIRHTSLMVDGTMCYGHMDMEVSTTFQTEAKAVKERIHNNAYDYIYSSPLSRAVKLAHYCGYMSPIIDKRIMEFNFGSWEGMSWEQLMRGRSMDEWFRTWHLELPDDAETLLHFEERVYDFIEEVTTLPVERVAVFCHGGVINMARYQQGLIELDKCFKDIQPYGSVTSLIYDRPRR